MEVKRGLDYRAADGPAAHWEERPSPRMALLATLLQIRQRREEAVVLETAADPWVFEGSAAQGRQRAVEDIVSLGFPLVFTQPLSLTLLHGPQTWAVTLMLPLPLPLPESWALTLFALLQVLAHTSASIWVLNCSTQLQFPSSPQGLGLSTTFSRKLCIL